MSNTLDLSAAAGTPYQVKFVNHSSSAWTVFYIKNAKSTLGCLFFGLASLAI